MRARELLSASIAVVVAAALGGCGQDATTDASAGAEEAQATATAKAASQSQPARQYETVDEAMQAIRANVDVPVRLPANLPTNLELALDPKFVNGGAQLYLRGGKRNLIVEYGQAGFDGCGPTHPQRVSIGDHRGVMQVHKRGKHPYTTVVWPATPQHPVGTYGLSGNFSASELLRFARAMNTEPSGEAASERRGC
jgi:hypothetical protein